MSNDKPARPRKRAAKKTTPAPAREEAVAEEPPRESTDEAVAVTPPASVDEPVSLAAPPVAPAAQPTVGVVGLGLCVTCGAPAAVVADFPWTADKPAFCRKDVPAQYRFLLSA